jgi:molecular chaperone GrpE
MPENEKRTNGGTAMTERSENNNAVNAGGEVFSTQNQEQKCESNVNQQTETANKMPEQQTTDKQPESVQINKDELENIKSKAAKADEYYDRLLRVAADFDNYRKRMAREKAETVKFANESLIQKLLPVLDNFEAALNAANNGNVSIDNFKSGVAMIYQQLKNILAEFGLEEINALNSRFDPTIHEALSQLETTETEEGNVVAQIRKGYTLNSKLLRPASVVVAKKPEKTADNQSSSK